MYDVAIIGGGIVGLATAFRLMERAPNLSVAVLEKEARVAFHQTGRNSGVIHSGIYYAPGSMKAENCREGKRALVAFCEREGVAYDMCGKVIVAVNEDERQRLHAIYERGKKNRVACELIGPERLKEMEPHTVGVEAIYVPEAGIVDYVGVCKRLAELIQDHGYELLLRTEVLDINSQPDRIVLTTTAGEIQARYLINCGGLYADRIAQMSGQAPTVQVVPFRGEYFDLTPSARTLCRNLIYPVPDPAFPFLGVHFTRMIDGRVECGPSAVLAFAREGYTFGTVDRKELLEILRFPGFRRLATRHWRKGMLEIRQSLSKKFYLNALQHLIPEITLEDIVPTEAGVRAQAVTRKGELVQDFLFDETERMVHVINAASPAATAALNVGNLIVERFATRLN